ncbi:MAG: alpha-glucuronidase [Lactobacillaceae bacterium]|jgi:alpha-glucuronidase|nr:alpha-glucuronidase [Lactobacillaceae bacterium]
MDFDRTWLTETTVKAVAQKVFYFDNLPTEDAVSLRLRKEITEFVNATISTDKATANVIISVGQTNFDSDEAYQLSDAAGVITIAGNTTNAALYGFYALIRRLANKQDLNVTSAPAQSIRMINHWDQIDGTIERGYAGESIFFGQYGSNSNPDRKEFDLKDVAGDPFRRDYDRIEFYARMLASAGFNSVSLNNVNVRGIATGLIVQPLLQGVADIAKIFSSFGIKTFLAINWAAPKRIGGLETSDPLDAGVQAFWKDTVADLYKVIPDFGGFVVKADSEGEPGPYQYGRDHADGANMLAAAMAPHNGLVIWRTFVYNSRQDWRDRSTDRARAASDNFAPLDGKFADNVILQIKFGPIDFQTIEPLTPLFGALKHTNQMMEFQVTAEYLGHQIDTNYSVPQWKSMIEFDTQYTDVKNSLAKHVIRENSIDAKNSGFVAVGNVGMDYNWTGNKLSQANLYGFGRIGWDNDITPDEILQEWIAQAFDEADEQAREIVFNIMSTSNETFAKYNAPLGIGFMVIPNSHYGVSVNGYEYDRWGTYHFADRNGIGVDRTVATGTGYTGLYSEKVAAMYENLATMPDETLLFFHHVPYTHVLHSGKTVIQHIYDTHFEGFDTVEEYIVVWDKLEGQIDAITFANVQERLQLQKQNALEWRDQVNTYFLRMSGIADEKGRTIYA